MEELECQTIIEEKPKTKKVFIDKFYFCPKCHRRVEMPAFLKQGNINCGGKINITCPCNGIVSPQFKEVPIIEGETNA